MTTIDKVNNETQLISTENSQDETNYCRFIRTKKLCWIVTLLICVVLITLAVIIPTVLLSKKETRVKLSLEKLIRNFKNSSNQINITNCMKWKQHGISIAGGKGRGSQLHQLDSPTDMHIDEDSQCIYIADEGNDRIVKWKFGSKIGEIVTTEYVKETETIQISGPTRLTFDQKTNSLLFCSWYSRNLVRYPLQNNTTTEVNDRNVYCGDIFVDKNGDRYVSFTRKDEIRVWPYGKTEGVIIAGANERGTQLNQLNVPGFIFVDENQTVYVSDEHNHRVMKWITGATEGIIIAGGRGEGSSLKHLNSPTGVLVDKLGNVYVADKWNHRVMCWSPGADKGYIVVGGKLDGKKSDQLFFPSALSFDREYNLYVVDEGNDRIQKFDIDKN